MAPPIPAGDGHVNRYNLANSPVGTPRIYFVNGIRVSPRDHALTASYLSLLIERPIWGVYNATDGMLLDLWQCARDYAEDAGARLSSSSVKPAKVTEDKVAEFLDNVEKKYRVWNQATLSLFKELVRNRHQPQMVIAHSQGNLITSNALFVMEDLLGSAALQKVRVYSLASPAPAWPVSLRITNGGGGRQENAFMNDMVALLRPHNLAKKVGIGAFQNAGDFRTMPGAWPVSLTPHDARAIIATLNFLKSIRKDLGLPGDFPPDFLERSAKTAASALGG